MRKVRSNGFTLVELLVVIGIIALLIGVLLPVLSKARESGNAVKCSANLRSIGQGFAIYLAENKQYYPAAYLYNVDPGNGAPHVAGGSAATPKRGYTHWSWYIFTAGRKAGANEGGFVCPSLLNGGLPPTNPQPNDGAPGQQRDPQTDASVYDNQVRRLAYTVNEAICPRNKFSPAIERAGLGNAQYVRATKIRKTAQVILATEFWDDWRIVSESSEGDAVVKSHRPVHALRGFNDSWQLVEVPSDPLGRDLPRFFLQTSVPYPAQPNASRLNWVGRNHGKGKEARTNFLYCDGHVEGKKLEETLKNPNWQWGERVYSIVGEPRIDGVTPR
jgi:prepilin-type N-terminal cleavage/methylation domain-containing protein/prepilin-type processing-associated H-X9-DG protein